MCFVAGCAKHVWCNLNIYVSAHIPQQVLGLVGILAARMYPDIPVLVLTRFYTCGLIKQLLIGHRSRA